VFVGAGEISTLDEDGPRYEKKMNPQVDICPSPTNTRERFY